jgi:hypothetical protein
MFVRGTLRGGTLPKAWLRPLTLHGAVGAWSLPPPAATRGALKPQHSGRLSRRARRPPPARRRPRSAGVRAGPGSRRPQALPASSRGVWDPAGKSPAPPTSWRGSWGPAGRIQRSPGVDKLSGAGACWWGCECRGLDSSRFPPPVGWWAAHQAGWRWASLLRTARARCTAVKGVGTARQTEATALPLCAPVRPCAPLCANPSRTPPRSQARPPHRAPSGPR